MNRKGFTLIEILATITIIGILSTISIIGYTRYVERTRQKAYDTMVISTLNAMENYAMDHPGVKEVTLEELMDGQYIERASDPRDKKEVCRGKVVLHENTDPTLVVDDDALTKNEYNVSLCCIGYNYTYEVDGKEHHKDKVCKVDPFDINSIPKIPVLWVYPIETYKNQLTNWMITEGNGKGKMDIIAVSMDSFNANPESYLGTPGNWKYQVIVFGFSDCNSAKDLNSRSVELVEKFIKEDNSVLFGHDTLIDVNNASCGNHSNFNSLAKYVNIELHPVTNSARYTTIKIVRDGIFTRNPWNLGDVGKVLTNESSHTSNQIAHGDIWLTFNTASDPKESIYLSTYRNNAFIQTGHNGGKASDAEKKILANVIFYLIAKQYLD